MPQLLPKGFARDPAESGGQQLKARLIVSTIKPYMSIKISEKLEGRGWIECHLTSKFAKQLS